jgi:superoxide dismutase, Cu-Zn family
MTPTQIRLGVAIGSILVLSTAAVIGCDADDPAPANPSSSGASGNPSGGTSGTTDGTSSGGTSGTVVPTLKAKATITATGVPGHETVAGTALFEQTGTGDTQTTKVIIDITGAKEGTHGFHIHDGNNCNAENNDAGAGAKGHWNPLDAGHALPADPRHMGDLGNVLIDAQGKGHVEITSTVFSIDGTHSVVGHAVIFHEKNDDGAGPTGNAGGRPGCGVIARE